jgi:hypothetical protein
MKCLYLPSGLVGVVRWRKVGLCVECRQEGGQLLDPLHRSDGLWQEFQEGSPGGGAALQGRQRGGAPRKSGLRSGHRICFGNRGHFVFGVMANGVVGTERKGKERYTLIHGVSWGLTPDYPRDPKAGKVFSLSLLFTKPNR